MFKSLFLFALFLVTSLSSFEASATLPMQCRKQPNTQYCKSMIQRERQINSVKHTPTRSVSQHSRHGSSHRR